MVKSNTITISNTSRRRDTISRSIKEKEVGSALLVFKELLREPISLEVVVETIIMIGNQTEEAIKTVVAEVEVEAEVEVVMESEKKEKRHTLTMTMTIPVKVSNIIVCIT